tara:strand:- start:1137 stop:1340 length:204 start_codon:yes stop_codon:yes gene_type:complete
LDNQKIVIQTCGSHNPEDGYSITMVFNDYHSLTFDGLAKEDLEEIKSCIECLLWVEESELDENKKTV